MDYKELQDILSTLDYSSYKLEQTYADNEGEVTDEEFPRVRFWARYTYR